VRLLTVRVSVCLYHRADLFQRICPMQTKPDRLVQELAALIARHGDGHPRVAHLRWLLASHRRAQSRAVPPRQPVPPESANAQQSDD
jgi:hypothetical protein